MKIYHGIESIDDALRGAALAVGNFDGVHLGHQRILRTAHALARVSSASVLAMTFEPHPLAVLRPEQAPQRLTLWDEKVRQLEAAGADAVVRLDVDRSVLSLSAEDFVREVLIKRVHPSYIVEGPNFGFGRGRTGDVALLGRMSARGGFQLRVVEPYAPTLSDGKPAVVSSTLIRECLTAGRVEDAATCLGRPYCLIGSVARGAGAGKKLGFPTINLDVSDQLVPADGVYAGRVAVDGMRGRAAISIGHRPTLGGTSRVIEAFVLDAAGDWYGKTARLDLAKRLRDQIKFSDANALTEQIAKDVEAVRAAVASE